MESGFSLPVTFQTCSRYGWMQPSPEGCPSTPRPHTVPTAGLQAELSITSFQQLLPVGEANPAIVVLA